MIYPGFYQNRPDVLSDICPAQVKVQCFFNEIFAH
jgi:hypothetical protein